MRLLYSLVIILIFNQYRLSARTNTLEVQKFSSGNADREYIETVPVRVDQAGKAVYTLDKQFLSFDDKDDNSESLYYKVTAFGRTFNLKLTRDRSFISPGLSVEYVYSWDKTLELPGDLGHCFYKGKLQDSHSSAVFNLCNGIQGSFITDGHEYFVEKKENQQGNSSSNIHIIYRRLDTVRKQHRDPQTFCGLKDTSMKKNFTELHVDKILDVPKRRRSKRYLDAAFVETMITVDKTMVEAFHNKAELQSFLITVMGLVARIYSHESIGNLIKIVLVKIFILENDLPELSVTSNAANTLTSFCRWQKKMNKPQDSDSTHYDASILITKHDICRAKGQCDTLGLAQVGGICHSSRSCALVEATGLNTAYTIAHELAHIFDVSHDGDGNRCSSNSGLSRIMAPTLSFHSKPWEWSPCSSKAFTDVLDLGHGECLRDRPDPSREGLYDHKLPGEIYSADEQCQMLFGKRTKACAVLEACRRLWCIVDTDKPGSGCKTHHLPWADGTPCGANKWCFTDKCVPRRRHRSVHGNWGSWTPYGPCTRTCGGGISFSQRKCDNPAPKHGGMYCWGPRKRFRSCNTEECPPHSRDFRYLQCSKLNNKKLRTGYQIKNITWVPKYITREADLCKLYCKVKGSSMHYRVSNKVIDGTPCKRFSFDVCVEGQCRKAGCDHVVGSRTRIDMCGVCGGDNSSCRKHRGYFNKKTKYGLNFVYDIPVGSTHVLIKQYGHKANDDNYLALESIGNNKTNFFNSKTGVIFGEREIMFYGIKIWYSGSDKKVEVIRIHGKTSQVLRIKVISFGDQTSLPQIAYYLNVPYVGPTKYYWSRHGAWSSCNKYCQGRRRRRIICIRRDDNTAVRNKNCKPYPKPKKIAEQCNTHCTSRWYTTRIGKCSTLCGKGTQLQRSRCIIVHGPRRWESASKDKCKASHKPPDNVPCEGRCETKWLYTNWSKCSKSCGSGVQRRFVNCVNSAGDYLSNIDCKVSEKQAVQKSCSEQECPGWIADPWSTCSVTCGNGRQERRVQCRSSPKRAVVSDSQCDRSTKPDSDQACEKHPCVQRYVSIHAGSWQEQEWTECSVTCGKGIKRRQVICINRQRERIHDENCDKNTQPKTEEECKLKSCTSWRFGKWGMCSKSCGKGLKLRIVKCAYDNWKIADDKLCKGTKRPPDYRDCQIQPCHVTTKRPYKQLEHTTIVPVSRWEKGRWGHCSVSCGKGVRRRSVRCKFINGHPSRHCPSNTKPQSTTVCNPGPCPQWVAGDWNPCSVTCGTGEQSRSVTCDSNRGKCDVRRKPSDRRVCRKETCPTWTEGPWSKCSKTCGGGVKLRTIKCSRSNGGCDSSSKPVDSQECNKQECPRWTAGAWTGCSVSCGGGTQSRSVRCINGKCNSNTKPTTTQRCNIQTCPTWTAGRWNECSKSCGEGVQVRKIDCSVKGACDQSTRPLFTQICNLGPCPKWVAEKWSSCSVSCGRGVMSRDITCNSGKDNCEERTKPSNQRDCVRPDCPSWGVGTWGQCSTSCGEGVQKRPITCQPPSGRCDRRLRPEYIKLCNPGLCPAWITADWSKCSVSCGGGVKRREVECNSTTFECDDKVRPLNAARCNLGECPKWTTTQWSQCSSSCGHGVQTRTVTCHTSSAQCDSRLKPANTKACTIGLCPAWKTGAWSKCSVSCGVGTRSRAIECNSTVFECDGNKRPSVTERCNRGTCPIWTAGRWSECSSSCGQGVQSRSIKCQPASAKCNHRAKPGNTRRCNLGQCPSWKAAPWSKCSASCGGGVRRRSVQCNSTVFACDENVRPLNAERCNLVECPVWITGHWSTCSLSCGDGVQRRQVSCEPSSASCNRQHKPVDTKLCNPGLCPAWTTGGWTTCSVSCGDGARTRSVQCNSTTFQCNQQRRPLNAKRCNPGRCPVWTAGHWSVCSVTCGEGVRSRDVQCSTPGAPCTSTKPRTTRVCKMDPCPRWTVGTWQRCSVTCGKGVQRRSVGCNTRKNNCDPENKPSDVQNCEPVKCPEWTLGDWGQCSVSCGVGEQSRTINCDSDKLPCKTSNKPDIRRVCNTHKCPTWISGDWNQCSVSCGKGIQSRTVTCDSDSLPCDSKNKPSIRRVCNTHKCPTWISGDWNQCSVSCGVGVQSRTVTCDSDKLPCKTSNKPDIRRVCNTHKCPTWISGDWNQCSVSCGVGVQSRTVTCDSDKIPCRTSNKPDIRRVCNTHKCPTWVSGDWNQCSVSCGKGIQSRTVTCSSKVHGCNNSTKPLAIRHCTKNCSQWIAEPWQKCSVTCGKGVQYRNVYCNYAHGACHDNNSRPRNSQRCRLRNCPGWITGDWSNCSTDCGKGKKSRFVMCSNSKAKCNKTKKPSETKDCQISVCPLWRTGDWSQCSRTCGDGITSRQVQCVRGKKTLRPSSCSRFVRPLTRKNCHLRDCVRGTYWKKGPWGKCSAQCSKGLQIRQVTCAARNGSDINSIFCRRRKPKIIRSCNEHKQCGDWEVGPWSKCSMSCGDGVRSRAVRCLYNLEYSNEDNCDASARPIDHKPCAVIHCPLAASLFSWNVSPWSKCSRTCGYGRKSRRVTCNDDYGGQVSSKYCDQESKPPEFLACFEVRCPPKWKFGDWSECSKTCDSGYQVRPVTCEGVPGAGGCNARKKPPVWRPCNFGPCSKEYLWKSGPWTRCSVSCGSGFIRRSVRCIDRDGKSRKDSYCRLPALKPDETRPCRMTPCTPKTCREIQLTSGLQADGEHVVEIQGKLRKIYCHGMTTLNPKEYITLKKGYTENFSEIYSKRLLNPDSCPVNKSHSDSCPCHRDNYESSGGSYFSKVRVVLPKMIIDGDDLQFAMTRGNKPPSYGTAGDCYSRKKCPQGRFSINLDGTGFGLSLDIRWSTQGTSASQTIYFYPDGNKVFGQCGGYCGTCIPDTGIQIVLSKGNELG